MTRRIEPVETYATLFRWAATYSLLLTDDTLHVVRLGPAMGAVGGAEGYLTGASRVLDEEARQDRLTGNGDLVRETGNDLGVAMAAPVLERVEARYGVKVAEGVQRLASRGHHALSAEKGSFQFRLSEIQSFGPGKKGGLDTMDLKTSGRDFPFKVLPGGASDLRAFADAVMAARGA
ncbi:hypothetical protein [Rubrivirga sp. IMCC43871]|uniref:hypothetical protein n=1 Tax=Rubrivirga sp. IMCC43871 TaxID=3391575 RepID=UPI0039903886